MLSLYRGLLAGLLVAGLAALCSAPTSLRAQDKKDAKDTKDAKEKAKDDLKERSVGVGTSDGLTLSGYWFQGVGIEKQRPDAVMMFPAPGSKINDSWIGLARSLSEKNFSVLLFDWRGCGLNGIDGQGARIFEDKDRFWKEIFNGTFLLNKKALLERQGLDYKYLMQASTSQGRYRDFILNDLMGARFYLDKQNDAGRCNTNRIWIVSEKEGSQLGMAFVAAEFQRNTVYDPKVRNLFDVGIGQFKSAGKDYAGMMSLSYSPTNTTASMIYRNALPSIGANDRVKEAMNHLQDRLAMVLMYNKKDGPGTSMALANSVGVRGTDEEMRAKFKYLKEFDIKAMKPISGIEMIDPMDSFGVKSFVVKAMVEISVKQNYGKDPTDREAGKMVNIPRFDVEKFLKR